MFGLRMVVGLVCCAVSQLEYLVSPSDVPVPLSFTADACMSRCGPTCSGVGSLPESPCVGCVGRPGVPGGGSVCGAGYRALRGFEFRSGARATCDAWSCRAGSVAGTGSRSIVGGHGGRVDVTFSVAGSEVEFVGGVVPAGSRVVGPGVVRVRGGVPLVVEHPATLSGVTLVGSVGGGCAVEVRLPYRRRSRRLQRQLGGDLTALTSLRYGDLDGWGGCGVLVTPSDRRRAVRGYGSVSVVGGNAPPPVSDGAWDVVLRSVSGTATVTGDRRVLLYERVGGETSVRGGAVTNLTSLLSLFSPEYLVEYFHDGVLDRGVPVPRFVSASVWYVTLVAFVLVASAVAVGLNRRNSLKL